MKTSFPVILIVSDDRKEEELVGIEGEIEEFEQKST